ncbi:MAG: helix-turn-helix domain-containing protein [Rikenellaceae bacterium]|nr:helix-turn-helix domain-containing protein [Rikenellaceae bacterium]
MKKVAEKLKDLRHTKGITQEVVYFDTNINVKRIEVGSMNISLTTIAILCEYYGTTLEDFFKGL